ncbi:unnamed protein product, partial [marine sediment metagenome]
MVGVSKGSTGIDANGNNTARLMSSVLRGSGWSKKEYKVLINKQATKQKVINKIKEIESQATKDDKVVIAFFCHGNKTGMRMQDAMLAHKELRNLTADLKSEHQLFIIAHCNSGGAVDEGIDGITLAELNRLVVTSCGELSVDPCTHRYTRWAEKFLKQALKEGQAYVDGEDGISIQDAVEFARTSNTVW